jgi:NAD(P)-dependent dehydrogenase (short-subunit alcohol dehydrogenase family)
MPRPVVFITGAGRGVGRAIALRFARDGYVTALAGRTEKSLRVVEAEVTALGTQAAPIACDVTDRAAVDRAVREADSVLGPIDVLVNNAGVSDSAPFASMDDEMWEQMISVNLTGTYNCMRAVIPGMFERRQGRVINIASVAAKTGFPYTAAYVAAKHGVLGLTRAVALEADPRGVTVNAICPGWLNNDMNVRTIDRNVSKTGRTAKDARRMIEKMNPQGRLIEPDEVADVAAFLASRDGARINGQAIDV